MQKRKRGSITPNPIKKRKKYFVTKKKERKGK